MPTDALDRGAVLASDERRPQRGVRSSAGPAIGSLRGSVVAGLVVAAVEVAAITLVLYPISTFDPGVSSGVLYVLGVLVVATYWGLWLGLLTALASAAALDFFHTEPQGELSAASAGDLVAIGVMLGTSVVASVIADRARQRADEAEQRLRLEEELREREAERIRVDEVRASRARVLDAAYGERRRLVRNIHDGAQQRLVHTVVTLKLAHRVLEREHAAHDFLDEALDHAQRATSELRELAHGILPPVLTRGGLEAGVDALASRMPLPVELTITTERFSPTAEATAYFVVAEALTNVVKHAHARRAWVTATIVYGRLRVEVRDDGVGGAWSGGAGLLGMDDRLQAADGTLRIESSRGSGTLIAATIPVDA